MSPIMLALAFLSSPQGEMPKVVHTMSVVLKVTDRVSAADSLTDTVEKLGGYFSSRTDDSVVLKVPSQSLKGILDALEPLGMVLERQQQTSDITFAYEQQKALLASREQILQRYFQVLNEASASAVVTVERQMTALIQQIEYLRGQLRMLNHRMAFAEVVVSFRFRDRQQPVRDGNSSFRWLNTMNMADLVGGFAHDED